MDLKKFDGISRRAAVLGLGALGLMAVPEAMEAKNNHAKAERRRRRRVNLTCPQCPPAPNCTLTNGTTCTCNPDGVPCVCDSCCPVCPTVCPTGQTCQPGECPTVCPDNQVCVDPDHPCHEGQECADPEKICHPEHVCCGGEGRVCTEESKICKPPFKCVEEVVT